MMPQDTIPHGREGMVAFMVIGIYSKDLFIWQLLEADCDYHDQEWVQPTESYLLPPLPPAMPSLLKAPQSSNQHTLATVHSNGRSFPLQIQTIIFHPWPPKACGHLISQSILSLTSKVHVALISTTLFKIFQS